MAAANLTSARLRELLHYDSATGIFTRRIGVKGYAAGTQVGGPDSHGYIRIGLLRQRFLAHRLAWLYVHGRWPVADIDHINGVRTFNAIANLREATRSENLLNKQGVNPHCNKSGFLGVSWCRITESYVAELSFKRKRVFRQNGFLSAQEASTAYRQAKHRLLGT